MGLKVTLTGSRHTDGTEGRLSIAPRVPWQVSSGVNTTAPGPLFFKITSSGTLTTLAGDPAVIVPTYDSNENMTFTPAGAAYLVQVIISGQEILETWTVDGANDGINWSSLGIKPTPSDRITYPNPLTTESPVPHYVSSGQLPAGNYEGVIAYVSDSKTYHGNNGTTWFRIA